MKTYQYTEHDSNIVYVIDEDGKIRESMLASVVPEGEQILPAPFDISAAKFAKRKQIDEWRLQANRGAFTHLGKQFACDELSRSDIDGVTSSVTLTGSLPANWPGAWKAIDNTYLPIATVDDWKAFVASMVQEGTANFIKSQTLKAQLEAATTKEAIEAIVW